MYTDPDTGITFDTWIVPNKNTGSSGTYGGLTFGVALPSDALEVDADEFIGILVTHLILHLLAQNPSNMPTAMSLQQHYFNRMVWSVAWRSHDKCLVTYRMAV